MDGAALIQSPVVKVTAHVETCLLIHHPDNVEALLFRFYDPDF